MPADSELQQLMEGEIPAAAGGASVAAAPAARKRVFQFLLLAGDALAGWGALILAGSWRQHTLTDRPLGLLLMLACWTVALFTRRLYSLRPARPGLIWAEQLLTALLTGTLLGTALTYLLLPEQLLPRSVYLLSTLLAWPLVGLVRWLGVRLGPAALVRERVLILGTGARAQGLAAALRSGENWSGAELLGAITLPGEATGPDFPGPVLGTLADCSALVASRQANHLVVTPLPPLAAEVVQCAAHGDALGVRVTTMETAFEELTWRAPVFHTAETWQASLETVGSSKYATRFKRLLDLAVALLVMPLALVLIGASALLIKLLSPGPVFYRQERVGKDGRLFSFLKLRTMVVDAEKTTGPVWAQADDPRVTPLGRFLRKTRLDEMPQLFLVLTGDMSLIGPRPERPFFVDRFRQEIPLYEKRLMVRPGITGWAQIHHNYDRTTDDVIEKLRYDLYYIRNLSCALDLQILLATVAVMLCKKGAH